jgi:hypothetical protein
LLDLADKGRLPITVATHIAVAFVGEHLFQGGVRASALWVLADIVSKIEMALDFASRFLCVGVHLVSPNTNGIVSAKIPTTSQAKLTHSLVAERFEPLGPGVERVDVRYHGENVDDWLGAEAWNGCAADMMERNEKHVEGRTDSLGFASERARPTGIVIGEYDLRAQQNAVPRRDACGRRRPQFSCGRIK